MSAVSVLGTISCLADRAVDAVSVSSHWVFSRCVRSRALGDVMASAYLQDSKVLSPECCDSVLAAGNPDGRRGKGGDEVWKWRLQRQVCKPCQDSRDMFAVLPVHDHLNVCVQSEMLRVQMSGHG